MLLRDRAGAGIQVARAGVITQSGPEFQHVVELGGAKVVGAGAALQDPLITGGALFGGGLVYQDAAQPHGVGIVFWAGKKTNPSRVWLSEIMLQQTTVKAVAP